MEVILKAKHFKNTDFADNRNCAIAKSLKESGINQFELGFSTLGIGNKVLRTNNIPSYNRELFNKDSLKAQEHSFDETVIRTVEYTDLIP